MEDIWEATLIAALILIAFMLGNLVKVPLNTVYWGSVLGLVIGVILLIITDGS